MRSVACIALLLLLAVGSVTAASALGHGNWRPAKHHHRATHAQEPHAQQDAFPLAVHEKLGRASHFDHLDHPVPSIAHRASVSLNCTMCEGWTTLILSMFKDKVPVEVDIATVVEVVCEKMQPMCHITTTCREICAGLVTEFAPTVFAMMWTDFITPINVCVLLEQCPVPDPIPPPTDIPVRSNLDDLTGEVAWPSWSKTSGEGFFVHLSDVHLALNYSVGSNTDCGLPVCCETRDGVGGNGTTAGVFGDYLCDTPKELALDVLKYVASMDPQPDFVLYTGDDPAHDVWKQSRELNLDAINMWNSMVNDTLLAAHIPVFTTLGNHEAFPIDQFAGPGADAWLYDGVANALGKRVLPADAQRTFRFGGYYQQRVRPGLRVISLNSNYFVPDNFWVAANMSDAYHQLNWLSDVLSQCSARGEKAIIIAHAPVNAWESVLSDEFSRISAQYASVIVNMFVGHTHQNSLQVLHAPPAANSSEPGAPLFVQFIGGSIVPFGAVNPGFYVYIYNRQQVATKGSHIKTLVTDAVAHWADLPTINAAKSSAGQWEVPRFNMRKQLGAAALDAASIDAILPSLVHDPAVFAEWVKAQYKGVPQLIMPDPQYIACYIDGDSAQEVHACHHASGRNDAQIQADKHKHVELC